MELKSDEIKQLIEIFLDKWQNTDRVWNKDFFETKNKTYLGFEINVSFGKGNRAKRPWIAFLKYNQKVTKGVYPLILLNENNTISTFIGISEKHEADISDAVLQEINKSRKLWKNKEYDTDNIETIISNIDSIIQEYEKYFSRYKPGTSTPRISTKNIILYGSPGVGKTHNTNKLINLIESGASEKEIFETIQVNEATEYEKIDFKERVKFVTFHQSFGYEDFIEGFRPDKDTGKIELVDGVFKALCTKASKNIYKSSDTNKLVFDDALSNLLEEKIGTSQKIKIDLSRDNSYYEIYDYNHKSIYYTRQGRNSDEKYHTLSISTLKQMYEEEKIDIITGGLRTYYKPLLNKLLEMGKTRKIEKIKRENYYLIIDEINRGNISKIFGELITLIEEDKRDKLKITLPYSKLDFKIPSNLYIIGTMNSTDKSIALIDIALRRRFTFLKMKPNAELITNLKAKAIFLELNNKIIKKLGEDYQIGHSYFMNIEDEKDLEFVLKYKIEPLLEEYFYGDDSGLKEILRLIENSSDEEEGE